MHALSGHRPIFAIGNSRLRHRIRLGMRYCRYNQTHVLADRFSRTRIAGSQPAVRQDLYFFRFVKEQPMLRSGQKPEVSRPFRPLISAFW
jgi:hypothetical protein